MTCEEFESRMTVYKLKDKIISQISDEILSKHPDYDFFGITLTSEFTIIEKLVSLLVDKVSEGTLEKGSYKNYCQYCDEGR